MDPPPQEFARLETHLESKSYAKAAALSREDLKRYPRSARLHAVLGKTEFLQGRFKEAVSSFGSALEAGSKDPAVYRELGMSYFYLGEWEKARAFLEKVVDFRPNDQESMKTLAYLHYYLGEGQSAIRWLERVRQLDSTDLEAHRALDALLGLTGQYRAAQMVWTTDPASGIQLCYPGGWVKQVKERLGPVGKVTTVSFSDPSPDPEGRFQVGRVLLLRVYQNASHHPMPELFRGSWRPGEEDERGRRRYYATRPNPEVQYKTISRDSSELIRYLSVEFLKEIPESGREIQVNPWVGIRGQATYCLGEAKGEDPQGRALVGYSLGIYDPGTDLFGALVLYGRWVEKEEVEPLSEAIFHLALFGGTVGIPPLPEEVLPPEEYQARIEGFLQAGQVSRALTEGLQAIRIYPEEASLHALVARTHQSLGKLEEAARSYQRARSMGLSTFSLESALGEVALGIGQPAEGAQAFLRALQFKPADPQVLLNYAKAAYRQGDQGRALQLAERALVESPQLETARYFVQSLRSLQGESGTLLRWFKPAGQGVAFCVPAGWAHYGLDQKPGEYQALFTEDPVKRPFSDFQTGLLYIRYERASHRVGQIETRPKPEEVALSFLTQAFERISDPQKVIQPVSPVYQRGADRYVMGGYAYTEASRRRAVRTLSYYQTVKDRLYVLTFRATGSDLGDWDPFVTVCFDLARFE